jgi:hypothetical protein
MNGKGLYTFSDGSEYIGNYINGVKEGKGILKKNDRTYIGEFKEGKPDGSGYLVDKGNQYFVTFIQGKLTVTKKLDKKDPSLEKAFEKAKKDLIRKSDH